MYCSFLHHRMKRLVTGARNVVRKICKEKLQKYVVFMSLVKNIIRLFNSVNNL